MRQEGEELMSKEAMKLALDALVEMNPSGPTGSPIWHQQMEAITALREALAEQPAQQEPVGTYGEIFESMRSLLRSGRQADQQIYMAMQCKPLYTSPQRTWVGLTDEEIEQSCVPLGAAMLSFTEVARAIEAKLKEKNT